MGVVLNPIAYRVGYKYSWKDAWYSHRLTYSVFVHDVLAFKALMLFVFYRYFSYRSAYWLYSHLNVYIFNNKIFVNLYLYDANEVQLYYNLSRRYKKIGWYKLNAVSGWFKGHFFDRKSRVKRFHYFLRTLRFFYDLLIYEDFRYVVRKDRRTVFKLKELHNKKTFEPLAKNISFYYNKKLKAYRMANFYSSLSGIWLSWEEIKPYRLPIRNMVFNTNHLSVKWWTNRYNIFYKKGIKRILNNEKRYLKKRIKNYEKMKDFKFEKRENSKITEKRYFRKFSKRILNRKLQQERELADINSFKNERRFSKKFLNEKNLNFRFIKSNNRLLFTFLSFFSKLFSSVTYAYDRKIFMRKWVRRVIRFYTYFIFKKMIIKSYGKFVEYLAACLNLNFNVKIYILNNNSVGAIFISRFIAIGLRSKFDYLDMIIPIRKNLRRQMYVRRWSEQIEDRPRNYNDKKYEIISIVSTLKDIFYFRMQRINNFLRFKRSLKKKYKFSYYNNRLYNNIINVTKFSNSKLYNKNLYNIFNKNLNLKLIKNVINKLSKFNFELKSRFWIHLIALNLLNKNILFFFIGSIWYRFFFFKFLKSLLNKKMFYYYCSFFFQKLNIKNYKILSFLNLVFFIRSSVNIKEKSYLKYFNYFYLQNKYNYFKDFLKRYLRLYIKRLKRRKHLKKKRFVFLCKKNKLSRKLKFIRKKRKRKFSYVWIKNKRNKKSRKKLYFFSKPRKVLLKSKFIFLKNNIFNFNKDLNYYFYNNNYYFYTNKYNNFILNSFYNGKYLSIFINNFNIKKRIKFIVYLKRIKYFLKNLYFILNKRNKFLNFKYFKKFSSKFKRLYELYFINKSILENKINFLKFFLNKRKRRKIIQFLNFSFFNLLIVYRFFFKVLKKINLNVKYYNYKFKYFSKKKNLKKKKVELRYLHLYSIIRYFYRVLHLIKYFSKHLKRKKFKMNLNSLLLYKIKLITQFYHLYNFDKITAFITNDRTKNMFFYYFNDITNFNYKYNVNIIALKERARYLSLYLSLRWEGPRVQKYNDDLTDKYKVPIFLYNKTKRMRYFDNNLAILYGYKFHFVGRFTRKQQAANLWYRLGSLANSSAIANVDYAIYSVVMRYSVCTVKVWLYKSKTAPKFKYRVF